MCRFDCYRVPQIRTIRQGIQLLLDVDSGFAGVGCAALEWLHDEAGRIPVASMPCLPPAQDLQPEPGTLHAGSGAKRSQDRVAARNANLVTTWSNLLDNTAVVCPLSMEGHHTKAVEALRTTGEYACKSAISGLSISPSSWFDTSAVLAAALDTMSSPWSSIAAEEEQTQGTAGGGGPDSREREGVSGHGGSERRGHQTPEVQGGLPLPLSFSDWVSVLVPNAGLRMVEARMALPVPTGSRAKQEFDAWLHTAPPVERLPWTTLSSLSWLPSADTVASAHGRDWAEFSVPLAHIFHVRGLQGIQITTRRQPQRPSVNLGLSLDAYMAKSKCSLGRHSQHVAPVTVPSQFAQLWHVGTTSNDGPTTPQYPVGGGGGGGGAMEYGGVSSRGSARQASEAHFSVLLHVQNTRTAAPVIHRTVEACSASQWRIKHHYDEASGGIDTLLEHMNTLQCVASRYEDE